MTDFNQQSNAEVQSPIQAQHDVLCDGPKVDNPASEKKPTPQNQSMFESMRNMFYRMDERIQYHCIDRCLDESNNVPKDSSLIIRKRKKRTEKIILQEEKMTSKWGPSHTLEDDDDDGDIDTQSQLIFVDRSKSNATHVESRPMPGTPHSFKEKSSSGTPDTAEITPEREDVKSKNNVHFGANTIYGDSTNGASGGFMFNSILGACGTQMSALSITANASIGDFLKNTTSLKYGDPALSRLQFAPFHLSCIDTPCTYIAPPTHSRLPVVSTNLPEDENSVPPIMPTSPGTSVLERRKNRHQLKTQLQSTNEFTFEDVNDKSTPPPPPPTHLPTESQPNKFLSFWQTSNAVPVKNTDPNHPQKPGGLTNDHTSSNRIIFPVDAIDLREAEYQNFEESISELTMRSSHGEATAGISENRRMAYYAVGKHYDQKGGGNRRCYFTGKLIAAECPFYAGCVQQGLRTLVVFCLPSAIGLPRQTSNIPSTTAPEVDKNSSPSAAFHRKSIVGSKQKRKAKDFPTKKMTRSPSNLSQVSLLNHEQLLAAESSDSDDDNSDVTRPDPPNNNKNNLTSSFTTIDIVMSDEDDEADVLPKSPEEREAILQALPDPNQDILDEMKRRYPDQFTTLPPHVRSPHCWRLFVRFCFFSGLPIAEGELHYKVKDSIANTVCGEEIVLSHDVMEAVNGEQSADILRLPNKKTFKYLNKHYVQQSSKLTSKVFDRRSWEMVRAEF